MQCPLYGTLRIVKEAAAPILREGGDTECFLHPVCMTEAGDEYECIDLNAAMLQLHLRA